MSKSTLALVCFVVAVILAGIAAASPAAVTPYHSRLLSLALAFVAAGLAVEAS